MVGEGEEDAGNGSFETALKEVARSKKDKNRHRCKRSTKEEQSIVGKSTGFSSIHHQLPPAQRRHRLPPPQHGVDLVVDAQSPWYRAVRAWLQTWPRQCTKNKR
ncbi:uncharacterized protein MONBRDRAFT_13228 [Monosiga brevicollis MX1]|uniref:Uncharacterized protein n=1 Tax=Monosiga brevicollis TaxID=81824 RepID=A9VEM5_MONBE|nr:uncharacterized protein MONBRDRAFT_13228 [Monosiga brevicollis MX1]EDQ84016.1 predicted protein [Monosiga brevicollis MX1]|eukprot:XP_001751172.1 hypothetical protein [Monosiga brevicollis MX1]